MSEHSQFALLGERRFAPFFWTQFLGAMNDNVFKNGMIIFMAFGGMTLVGMDSNLLVNAAGAGDMAQRIFTDIGNGVIATMHEQNRHYNVRQLEAQARGTMQKVLNWMAEEGPISSAFARF